MTVGMQQPYLFPYLGYWQMVNAVDTFMIADTSHMIQNGWVHQNRLQQRYVGPFFFRLDLAQKHSTYMHPICEVKINKTQKARWNIRMQRTLAQNYRNAPYYDETMKFIKPLLENDETNMADYLVNQIRAIAAYLDMTTTIVRSKDILQEEEYNLPVMEKIPLWRDRLGFDSWLSLSNGAHYYTKEQMAEMGIDIRFHHIDPTLTYPQVGVKSGEPFVPDLSIIDVLMNCGKEGTKELLSKYTVI